MKCLTSAEGPTLCDRKTREEIITSARGQDISKLAYEYIPTGERNVDRLRTRLFILCFADRASQYNLRN